ncbi:hypothetical protein JTM11_19765 [Pseudomonas aeruginosa]|nr:hypothetical protein [Pseudomonas aeruginosa]
MNTLTSPVKQLANLGYDLVNGAMRFEAAMSMGASIIVRDENGNDLQISCNEGKLVVGAAVTKMGMTCRSAATKASWLWALPWQSKG